MEPPKTAAQLDAGKPMTRGQALDLLCKRVVKIVVRADPPLAESKNLQHFWDMPQDERVSELVSISSKVVFFGKFKGGLEKILDDLSALRGMVVWLAASLATKPSDGPRFHPEKLTDEHWLELQKVLQGWNSYFQAEFLDELEKESEAVSAEDMSEFDKQARQVLETAVQTLKLNQQEPSKSNE